MGRPFRLLPGFSKEQRLMAPWVALGKATNLVRYAIITKLYSNASLRRRMLQHPAWTIPADTVGDTELKDSAVQARLPTPIFLPLAGRPTIPLPPATHSEGTTGFVSLSKTPQLANVHARSCHGPAADRAANPENGSRRHPAG